MIRGESPRRTATGGAVARAAWVAAVAFWSAAAHGNPSPAQDAVAQAAALSQGPVEVSATSGRALSTIIGRERAQSLAGFVGEDFNVLEAANPELLDRLTRKWEQARHARVTILHFGDSHVQPGFAAQVTRHKLQSAAGSAGRGMVFPYSMAKTYSQNDYRSTFQGEWTTANSMQMSPKLPLGLAGFVGRTGSAQAAFALEFNQPLEPGAKVLRLFYRVTSAGYRLRVQSGEFGWEGALGASLAGDAPQPQQVRVLEIEAPALTQGLEMSISNEQPGPDDHFELHGLSIENGRAGVLHHNLGVGGAAFAALRAQAHFDEQSMLLAPDVVILDWGTNDIIYKNRVPADLEQTIVETIARVRLRHPQALIVLTTVQDTYYRRRAVTAAWDFAQMARRLALENDCLLYDWYRVAGGRDAMRAWYAHGLAQPDHVHLTVAGYSIKGELLGQAFLNSLAWRARQSEASRLWLPPQSNAPAAQSVVAWLRSAQPFQRRADLIRGPAAGPRSAAKSPTRKSPGKPASPGKPKPKPSKPKRV